MKKESKRITALTMSAMLMLNITATAVPVSAESGSKVYTHDGYTVEYTIKNEWTGNQNIEVTITNTGDDILSGWATMLLERSAAYGMLRYTVIREQNIFSAVQAITMSLLPVSLQALGIPLRAINSKFLRIL